MAVPVIVSTTGSVSIGYRQYEPWIYQPSASNSPTAWALSVVPDEWTFSTSTGRLEGPAPTAGGFNLVLTATNGDGTSAPLNLFVGIEPAPRPISDTAFEFEIDVAARTAKFLGADKPYSAYGDDFFAFITFVRTIDNVRSVVDVTLSALELSLKNLVPEATIQKVSNFVKVGEGSGAYYILHGKLDDTKLKAALAGYLKKDSQEFDARAQIEWVQSYDPGDWETGPTELRMTTKTFPYQIAAGWGEAVAA